MKDPDDLIADVRRRLSRTWADELIRVGHGARHWPHSFPLGAPQGAELDERIFDWAREWNLWFERVGPRSGLDPKRATRLFHGSRQTVPTHVSIATLDAAAQLAADGWPARLRVARARLTALSDACPGAEVDVAILRTVESYSEVDFALLLVAAQWFTEHPTSGLTPRQVPITGLHSKWLDSAGRRELICRLTGLGNLGLDVRRPHPVNFTYLDPDHRRAGHRVHDSIVPGDRATPAYEPSLALICENRDSAVFFPEVPGAIAIQGAGREGPSRLREMIDSGWLGRDARLVYWGDLDASGFEIVNEYRARGVAVETILMDLQALRTYAVYGVSTSPSGVPLSGIRPRPLTHLSPGERSAYEAVTSDGGLPPRVEQERIPLQDAVRALGETRG